jgi:hypothetical protein
MSLNIRSRSDHAAGFTSFVLECDQINTSQDFAWPESEISRPVFSWFHMQILCVIYCSKKSRNVRLKTVTTVL